MKFVHINYVYYPEKTYARRKEQSRKLRDAIVGVPISDRRKNLGSLRSRISGETSKSGFNYQQIQQLRKDKKARMLEN